MRLDLAKTLFLASLWLSAFGYGVATIRCHVFPFRLLQNAERAWQSLTAPDHGEYDYGIKEVESLDRPVVHRYSEEAGDELLLISGGEGFVPQSGAEQGCLAWIMNRQGEPLHVWRFDPAVWANLESIKTSPGKTARIYPVGMHLYPDGGLLVSFQGAFTFPYAIGLARFDKDSRLVWKKELLNHHWFSVADDGRIFALSMRPVDTPWAVADTRYSIASPDGKVLEDRVMILDDEGNVLDEIPILDSLIASGWMGLLQTQSVMQTGKLNNEKFTIVAGDPTHTNGVQLVDEKLAAAHPWLKPGDLLLSMRNMNAVAILDPATRRFKWVVAGAAIMQHSPRFHEDGVLVFDNRGGSAAAGGSQLVQIDLESRLPSLVFPQPGVALPGEFYSTEAGQLELSGSGRALLAVTVGQKIWEIDLKTGEVLWEYLCVDPEHHRRRQLFTAQYVHAAGFAFNR